MWSLRMGKIVFFGAMCGLLVAAVDVSWLIAARQEGLKALAVCDICAAAGGVELEFARLEQKIAAALTPRSVAGVEDVQLRFDALSERAARLDAGAFRAFTARDPASADAVRRLAAALAVLAPTIDRVDRPEVGEAALALLAPLDFDLSRLKASADRFGAARVAEGQAGLARLLRVFSRVVFGLFAFGAALLLFVGWHNRQLRLTRDRLRGASAGLEAANAEVRAVNLQLQARNAALGRRDREVSVQNERFDAALNNMTLALCMVDAHGRLVIYNGCFADLFGLDFAPIPGLLFVDLIALSAGPHLGEIHARQCALPTDGQAAGFVQDLADRKTLSVSYRPMPEGGWVATYDDISRRRQDEARIAYLAHHDALTGLANRAAFARRLDAAAADVAIRGGRCAVHALDIDGFGGINDGFGHAAGDALLGEVGRRLAEVAGEGDVVARLGGDEFALLQTASAGPDDEMALAGRVRLALARPFRVGTAEVTVSASSGIAAAPPDGADGDELMRNTDLALHAAKLDGGGAPRAFTPDMDAARRARRALEQDLRGALANGEFEVHFQPLVDVRSVAITGFEALVRWRHPERGTVPPSDFIPVVEELGLIAELGEWVLRDACAHAARWPGALTVAVNLSPAQFGAEDLLGTVEDALARAGLAPGRLELEITESVLMADGEGTLAVLHALRGLGVRIAMDDFGTGYSSLSYLRRFPFDKIKIDQSFVGELSSRPDCIKIVRSIAALGASLGMTTTAEGVETAEQFEQIRAAGCDQVQGFHFGRPEAADALRFVLGPRPAARSAA